MTVENDTDRYVVGFTDSHAIFVPGKMYENSSSEATRVNLGNVYSGLQWYQAFNTYYNHSLSRGRRAELVREIFRQPNDLMSLARVVEMQTGVSGLIGTVLESYQWAERSIYPRLPNVTERVVLKPHIGVGMKIGERWHAFSENEYRVESEDGFRNAGSNDKISNINIKYRFRLMRDGEDIHDPEDEHGILPNLALREVEVLPGRRIKLEGYDTEMYGSDAIIREPITESFSYILKWDGGLDCDWEIVKDRVAMLKEELDRLDETTIILEGEYRKALGVKSFDWAGIRSKIVDDPMATHALSYFVLPYCDMPTTDGHLYVLPVEMHEN